METCRNSYLVASGQIEPVEMASNMGQSVFSTVMMLGGAAVATALTGGAALPVLIGSFVGGAAGSMAFRPVSSCVMKVCVDSGVTFFGLVEQDYEVPKRLLSMLGMIMLVGIIVNNGIVLVDYINQLRIGGMDRRDAIADAAVTRLRPILMTSITTILGLIVMALGQSEATSLIQPLAVTCIGGLLYATLMTLYVVPVMYDALSKKALYHVDEADLELSEK